MDKTITLSKLQIKLLMEYKEADAAFESARLRLKSTSQIDKNFDVCFSEYEIAVTRRIGTACIFASSVAAEVK